MRQMRPLHTNSALAAPHSSAQAGRALLLTIERMDGNHSEPRDLLAMAEGGAEPLKILMVTGSAETADAVAATNALVTESSTH